MPTSIGDASTSIHEGSMSIASGASSSIGEVSTSMDKERLFISSALELVASFEFGLELSI